MKRLEQKAAVITGGAGGIGRATAAKYIEQGARVLLVDLEEESLRTAVKDLDPSAVDIVVADVTKEEDVEKYARKARELYGGVDIFFNNAGVEGVVQPIVNYPVEEFDKVVSVNIRGVWLGLKYMIPLMVKGGSIVITSSVAGLGGTANVSAYVASKHAVIGLMRTAALELAGDSIRVNTINPSPVDNRMMRSLEKGFSPDESEQAKSQFEQMIPLGRYATNDDIANLATFLASDESKFITGSVHSIDGGMTA